MSQLKSGTVRETKRPEDSDVKELGKCRKGWFPNGCPEDGTEFLRACEGGVLARSKRKGNAFIMFDFWTDGNTAVSKATFDGDGFKANATGWSLNHFRRLDD